jgi:hypothetical protein
MPSGWTGGDADADAHPILLMALLERGDEIGPDIGYASG